MTPQKIACINGFTATEVFSANVPANQRLWLVRRGSAVFHRVTSKGRPEPETFIFASDGCGRIPELHELPGSCKGERSHSDAIAAHIATLT